MSSEVFSPGTTAVEDEPESLVVDSIPDEAQAESNNATTKTRRPDTTACLITDDEPIPRHPGCKQTCSAFRPKLSRLISTATAPMCSALVKLTGLVGWTLLRRIFSRSRSFSDDSFLLGRGTSGN